MSKWGGGGGNAPVGNLFGCFMGLSRSAGVGSGKTWGQFPRPSLAPFLYRYVDP